MNELADTFPELIPCISTALSDNGHGDISTSLEKLEIERTTYDLDANAGYIYITPTHSFHFPAMAESAKKVSKTIETKSELWINIDIGFENNLAGIEILSPTNELVGKLQRLKV